MSFVKNVGFTFVTRIAITALSLVSSIVVAQQLGPDGKGIFAVLGVITGIAVQLGILGLNSANTHFAAKDPSTTKSLNTNTLLISLFVGGFIAGVLILILYISPETLGKNIPPLLLCLTIATIPLLIFAQLIQNILVGRGLIKTYNIVLLCNQIFVTVGTIVLLTAFGFGITSLVILTTIAVATTSLVFGRISFKEYGIAKVLDNKLLKESFTYGFKLYLNQFFYFLILRSDLYILNFYHGTNATGIYSVATQYADLLFMVSSTIALLLLPKMSKKISNKIEVSNQVTRISTAIFAGSILISLVIFKPLVAHLFGIAFIEANTAIQYLYIGIFLLSVETIMSMYIVGTFVPWKLSLGWALAAVINIVLNIIIIPNYGAIGAAITSSIAYTFIFFYVLVLYKVTTRSNLREIFIIQINDKKTLWKIVMMRQ